MFIRWNVIEDFTQTGHVTSVAVAEVNKPPPPLVADAKPRNTLCNQSLLGCTRFLSFLFVVVLGARVFLFFIVALSHPRDISAPPSSWKVSARCEVITQVFVFPHVADWSPLFAVSTNINSWKMIPPYCRMAKCHHVHGVNNCRMHTFPVERNHC